MKILLDAVHFILQICRGRRRKYKQIFGYNCKLRGNVEDVGTLNFNLLAYIVSKYQRDLQEFK